MKVLQLFQISELNTKLARKNQAYLPTDPVITNLVKQKTLLAVLKKSKSLPQISY